MTQFLLHPAVPTTLLVLWAVLWWNHRQTPPLLPSRDRAHARPGDVSRDGSKAGSKVEDRIRKTIECAGFRTYPPSTLLCVGNKGGRPHFLTPDIIVRKPGSPTVVEVDPFYTHGTPEKIAEDLRRHRFYASIGYKVVRVRIGGTEALSPNDVVITSGDFNPARHGTAVLRAIGSARRIPPHYWTRRR